jgi:C1A family cysteine protease
MPQNLIADVNVPDQYRRKIRALGYKTTDQLAGAAAVATEALSAYLGVTPAQLYELINELPRTLRPAGAEAVQPRQFKLGALIERVPRPRAAFAISLPPAAVLPAQVNLIAEMQPIRDQAQRGTCVAHACTAVAEHYWRGQGQIIDLSRQFLYWDCKQHDGVPNQEGTWIAVAMPLLQSDGCCLEGTWPYVPTEIPGNEGQGPPPAPALAEAPQYKIPSFNQLAPTSVADIKGELAQDRCVAFTIPVFNSWYLNAEVTRTGDIVNPIPGEASVGGHALCFVGYEDQPANSDLGGGVFYLRNSWDSQWATTPSLGTVGYGTIPYSYISSFCAEAFSIG